MPNWGLHISGGRGESDHPFISFITHGVYSESSFFPVFYSRLSTNSHDPRLFLLSSGSGEIAQIIILHSRDRLYITKLYVNTPRSETL